MSASQALIRGCQTGDPSAFDGVVDAHKDAVYTLCLRAVGDPERAEDLAERVFLAAHQAIVRLDPETNLFHWLLGLAIAHVSESSGSPSTDDESAVVNAVLGGFEPPDGRHPARRLTARGTRRRRRPQHSLGMLYAYTEAD